MFERILVITEKDRSLGNIFIVYKLNRVNYKKDLLQYKKNEEHFSLCIIEIKMSVQDYIELSKFVKCYFSIPICSFERNIVQSYPGESYILNKFIDIIVKKELETTDFYTLIRVMLCNIHNYEKRVVFTAYNDKIVIFPKKKKIEINDEKIELTKIEFGIFYYLFQKKGDVVSHKELYEKVWKREYIHDDTNIMAHIHRLRGKVEKDPKNPRYICNQYGIGYYFGSVFKEAFSTI